MPLDINTEQPVASQSQGFVEGHNLGHGAKYKQVWSEYVVMFEAVTLFYLIDSFFNILFSILFYIIICSHILNAPCMYSIASFFYAKNINYHNFQFVYYSPCGYQINKNYFYKHFVD